MTQWRDRWKIVRWSTSGAMAGTNCIALAPVPTTATRFPPSSTSWSQRDEWNAGPANVSSPSRSGTDGRLSIPTALMTAFASTDSSRPSLPRTCSVHRARSSSYAAAITSVSSRTCGATP